MLEIDLIPADYRDAITKKLVAVRFSIAVVVLSVLMVVAALLIGQRAVAKQQQTAELVSQNSISEQQKSRLGQLQDQHAEYQRQWSLLRSLRAGAAIDDVFSMIDRSIGDGDVWFDNWSFRRAGVTVDGVQQGVETGYFTIVTVADSGDIDSGLQVETHMTIGGHAVDHQALSRFVRALFSQSDVRDVRVQKTSRISYAGGIAVNFDLTITLNSSPSDS